MRIHRLPKKLRNLWRRRRLGRDLEDELRFHLEMKAEETADPYEARRRFGNLAAVQEACRELWTFAVLEAWWRDLRYAARTLARSPGFTLVAVAALALGIGADTAIFTIVEGALAWNMSLDNAGQIMVVEMTDQARRQEFGVSYPDFRDFQSQAKSLAGLAGYQFGPVNVSDRAGLPERYYCARMSANGFSVVRHKPVLGRDFAPEDEHPGAPAVLMLSYHVWQDRYGASPSILGKTVRVNEVPMTVIGVMPPGKRFPEETDLWTPLVPDANRERRDNRSLMLFGRLADGVKPASAGIELDTIARRLASQYPGTNQGLTASVQPIAAITGVYALRPVFAALWCAVGFVLLIACVDVANMLLARGEERAREISIRVALGAGKTRILRQLLVESVVLALAGGILGWWTAVGGLRWFDAGTGNAVKPVWLNLSLNRIAFAYLAVISAGTGILFGLAPALRLAKIDIHAAIKDGGHRTGGGMRGLRLSSLLVAFEMALCVVLLAGAGLMIRSAVNLYATPIGVDTSNVLTVRINLPEAKYPRPADELSFHRRLKARLEALPGVEVSALASNLPVSGWASFRYELAGAAADAGAAGPSRLGAIIASADYFRLLRVEPRRGRLFTGSDGAAGVPAVIVNESFAAQSWPGEEALGKRLRLIQDRLPQPWLTVVGVVPDILQNPRRPAQRDPLIYLPYAGQPQRVISILSRTRVPPATLAEAFRREVQGLDENLPVYDVRTLDDRIAENRLTVRLFGGTLSVFAAIALALAAVGLYAVIAHAVSRRTREIGIRMALGAGRREILRLVFTQGLRPLALGVAAGLLLAAGVVQVLRSLLVGVSPGDPLTFLAVVLVLVLTGVLGCAIPARRALRVDPAVSLRCD